MNKRLSRVVVAMVLAAICVPALGQQAERLLDAVPSGYQGVQEQSGNPEVTRYLPKGKRSTQLTI